MPPGTRLLCYTDSSAAGGHKSPDCLRTRMEPVACRLRGTGLPGVHRFPADMIRKPSIGAFKCRISGVSFVIHGFANKGRKMNRCSCLAAMLALHASCLVAAADPTIPATADSGDKVAILASLDHYVDAISANDLQTMEKMQTPEGMTYRVRVGKEGHMEIVPHPNSYWIDPLRKDGHDRRFRYWSPTVLSRGGIAVVWVSYEFWIDGGISHCGMEVFDFLKIDGDWRVSNAMWTVEPDACKELRPADSSQIRPVG
jgi:hypothetical protein